MEKKASEVVQLGDECPGGHRVDPVEAAQPGRGGRIQHACVPPIRLDPIPRRARDQRRRDDLAREALLRQFSLEFVAARPRLIRTQNRPGRFALPLPNQTVHRPGLMRNRSLLTAPTGESNRYRDRALVDIHPYVRGTLFHDRFLRMRLCRPRQQPASLFTPV